MIGVARVIAVFFGISIIVMGVAIGAGWFVLSRLASVVI